MESEGILYVIATPIGNLEDITLRALKTLNEVEVIFCEDTRVFLRILDHYGIKGKKLERYDEHVESIKIPEIVKLIKEGKKLALVTNAGTPTISDPGYRLVRKLREEGLKVIPIPGPSALITAISVSGLPTDSFVFYGFLPRKEGKRKKLMESWIEEERTIIFYESPERVKRTLLELKSFEKLADRFIFIAREMTKFFEEYIFTSLGSLNLDSIKEKGEFVLILEGKHE
ncbi:MAG: 16S rRNA (cytidine(1402)-2'-O)-methyltransferase [Candidatus Hydrothermia bacterium]|jgi:16S rRNA (cytidine1402-2'-O)-methyltransferase